MAAASLLLVVADLRAKGESYSAIGRLLGMSKWQARGLAVQAASYLAGYGEGFRAAVALRREGGVA